MFASLKVCSLLFLFGASLVGPANAGPFLDLGIAAAIDVNESQGRSCIRDYTSSGWGCSSNPLGYVGMGYKHKDFTIAVEHWSSLMHYDAGLNLVSIKYRMEK